jgi:hypothetical protein
MGDTPMKGDGFVVPSTDADTQQVPASITGRLGEVEELSKNILTLVVVSLVGIVVAVILGFGAIIVDQLHFNNELYRDGDYNHTKNTQSTVKVEQPVFFPNMKPSQ